MPNFNKVILAGNLVRDPELRFTPKGTAITKLGMAINRTWKNEAGESKEEVTFVDIDAFGRQAEVIAQYLKKGRPLMIEGRLKLDQWDDKQTGQKRSRLGVVLESFQFLDSKDGGTSDAPKKETQSRFSDVPSPGEPTPAEPDPEDPPF